MWLHMVTLQNRLLGIHVNVLTLDSWLKMQPSHMTKADSSSSSQDCTLG
jgi:hypothetical protein